MRYGRRAVMCVELAGDGKIGSNLRWLEENGAGCGLWMGVESRRGLIALPVVEL